jgi:hypothetical protein
MLNEARLRQIDKAVAAFVVGVLIVLSMSLAIWKIPKWQVASLKNLTPAEQFNSENEARKTLSQILGGAALLVGLYFTWRSMRVAAEGQITDRFTKAIEQLGDSKLEIRLGGIYALERIAYDSSRDQGPIMEVLTAFVRVNAKRVATEPGDYKWGTEMLAKRAPDIQSILTVIGRRSVVHGMTERIDLFDTNLRGADLGWADLHRVTLIRCDLSGSLLRAAKLVDTALAGAVLRDADLERADLSGADLSGADLTTAMGLTQSQIDSARGDAATWLPAGIERPKEWR